MDVRVQLIMSERACVFRQGSCGLKNCMLTSESQQAHMHENAEHNRGIMGTESNGYLRLQTPKSAMMFIC